ncbi:hypothetical protein MBLNU459_g1159t1 [Dothideomycetes sp. NU459]
MRSAFGLLFHLLALSPLAVDAVAAARHETQDQHVLLPPAPVIEQPHSGSPSALSGSHEFTLRHIYHKGSHQYPKLHRKIDIHPHTELIETSEDGSKIATLDMFSAQSRPLQIQRLADRRRQTVDRLLEAGRLRGEAVSLPPSAWTIDTVAGPNITDKETVLSFAKMASNAYILVPHTGEWEDVGGGFNYTEDFGWENDGLRGHIFADTRNRTIVIGLKGTSVWLDASLHRPWPASHGTDETFIAPAVFDGTDTTGNDKLNDNLFGSCCCGQGGQYLWKQVCDCQTSAYTCNSTCLVKNLRERGHYYQAAQELYHNVTELYPNADVWLTGHSLGGVVTSLLGATFGLPTVTYETFPDALAASRLGLPTPPGYHIGSDKGGRYTGTYHFGHTADPIYMGTCNAASSFCTIAGYAFQGQCHTGQTCTYDTVGDLGWRVAIGTHKISSVIKDVITKYDTVPVCEADVDCVDCYNWKFFESNGTETTTSRVSTTTSSTRTRTATCKTPGWWGCLDESTTTTVTTTQTLTTTSCRTPGWFGCKDPVTTTQTTTITSPAAAPAPTVTTTSSKTSSAATSSSTDCETPGWFGCNDPSSTSTSDRPSHTQTRTKTKTKKHCTSKEWFGFICVDPSPDEANGTPSPTPTRAPALDL